MEDNGQLLIDGWMDGLMDGWMDGLMADKLMHELMDG